VAFFSTHSPSFFCAASQGSGTSATWNGTGAPWAATSTAFFTVSVDGKSTVANCFKSWVNSAEGWS